MMPSSRSRPPCSASLVPVLRQPRRQWRIPPLPSLPDWETAPPSEAERRACLAGTTPQGREILRKILFEAETACGSAGVVVARLEAEFRTFRPLQPEFARLLGRLWGSGEAVFRQASPRGLAVLVWARVRGGRRHALASREDRQGMPTSAWRLLT